MVVLDVGRLMAAPLGDRTRCDEALDAATALALVADELGDRCGAIAFDDAIRRRVRPGRASGADVVRATFDLEPSERDADYELAFRTVGGGKRALVVVLTDLLDDGGGARAGRRGPGLTRRHAVLVASARDLDVEVLARARGDDASDPYMSPPPATSSPPAPAPPPPSAARAPRSWRRSRAGWARRACGPTCGRRRGGAACERPATPATPSTPRPAPTRPRTAPPRPSPRATRSLRRLPPRPATARSPGRSPSPAAPARQGLQAPQRPRRDQRPAHPQPGRARDDDARQLQHAVGDDQPRDLVEVPVRRRDAEHRAEDQPVVHQQEAAAGREQQPGGEGQERHLDVVGEDLATRTPPTARSSGRGSRAAGRRRR